MDPLLTRILKAIAIETTECDAKLSDVETDHSNSEVEDSEKSDAEEIRHAESDECEEVCSLTMH